MVDGVSGTDLYRIILDTSPEPSADRRRDDWHPQPPPSDLSLAAAAILDLALLPARQARAVGTLGLRPRALLQGAGQAARGTGVAGPRSGPGRRHDAVRAALGPPEVRLRQGQRRGRRHDPARPGRHLQRRRPRRGHRRLPDLLLERGERPVADAVRTLVPVSVRAPGEESIRDNRVSLLLADLPVHVLDPVERLVVVRERLTQLKEQHEAEAGVAVLAVAGIEPFPSVAAPTPTGGAPAAAVDRHGDHQRARTAAAPVRPRAPAHRDRALRAHRRPGCAPGSPSSATAGR